MDEINKFKQGNYFNNYVRSYVTNTRLMGVVSIVAYFKDTVHIYLLDFEEYGIDTFYKIDRENKKEIKSKILKTSGGLGGNFVNLNKNEFKYLLIEAFDVNRKSINSFKELRGYRQSFIDYEVNLDEEEKNNLFNKITTEITCDYELVNYFMMREVGNDRLGKKLLCSKDFEYKIADKPYTLLKNTIEESDEGSYICESIIDFKNKYMFIKSKVSVKKDKIIDAELIDKIEISPIEASFNLNRKEHILVYYYEDEFYDRFINDRYMVNNYDQGQLITVFNKNNDHVTNRVYYLNSDIYAVYYFLDNNQLVVSSFFGENISEIKDEFNKDNMLRLNGEFDLDKSLLYTFVNSKYDNFFEFIQNSK